MMHAKHSLKGIKTVWKVISCIAFKYNVQSKDYFIWFSIVLVHIRIVIYPHLGSEIVQAHSMILFSKFKVIII